MPRPRHVFLGLVLALTCAPGITRAQSAKQHGIAYLSLYSAEVEKPLIAAFRRGLQEHGYVEGRNVVIHARYAAGDADKVVDLAKELAALNPDLFVVLGPQAARAANRAAPQVPIVFSNLQDPLASGLIKSLARPGGNMTGMSDGHAASVTKRLELIKQTIPRVGRVGVLWNPSSATNVEQLKALEAAAPKLAVAIVSLPVRRREEIQPALQELTSQRATALLLLGDTVFTSNMRMIAEAAIEKRIAAVYTLRSWADVGGFMAYGANFPELWRRSAAYVDKILKGAKPGDLPIEQASTFDLVINLKTAKAIGVSVARPVLLRADHVIE
jgi:putative tryptophan/tyrosine transport system substrate-binding protein